MGYVQDTQKGNQQVICLDFNEIRHIYNSEKGPPKFEPQSWSAYSASPSNTPRGWMLPMM